MSARVDNFDGERIDIEEASREELERIRGELIKELENKNRVTPTRVVLDDIDLIEEELADRDLAETAQQAAEGR